MKTAQVLVCRNVPITYTYAIPEEASYVTGEHVQVPLGKSSCMGIIVSQAESDTNDSLKPITCTEPKKPVVSEELIALIKWMTDYYQLSPFKAYQCVFGKVKLRPIDSEKETEDDSRSSPHPLTDEQKEALQNIMDTPNSASLLFGVTASGKTEIYMRVAELLMKEGKGVIMLLPEIALTPQMRKAFTERFGSTVVVVHSGLTPKQREMAWSRIYAGDVRVVIGPRSAIFSPVQNLGLIVIDEEHEPSYKQESNPRYYTHHIAEFRRKFNQARLIYGSATPSIELYFRSQQKEHSIPMTKLSKRVSGKLPPPLEIIDMKQHFMDNKHPFLSNPLLEAIQENIRKKEKTLILLNRRGYASVIICQACHTIHACPECGLSFTYHSDRSFRCHRCDITEPLSHICTSCKKPRLQFGGVGTQKIETELSKFFPGTSILRLDRDTAKTAKETEDTLARFRDSGDILIGTQMIAKGHHFETVTLVGVLGIDTTLGMPDFRSSERAYQLLSQVAGRSGRGILPGRVLVQTLQPDHYAIEYAKTHQFEEFYAEEIAYRKPFNYPPFSTLVHLIVSSLHPKTSESYANTLKSHLSQHFPNPSFQTLQFLGPKPAPIEKVRGYYRWHILVKCQPDSMENLKSCLRKLKKPPKAIRFIVDYDPRSIL